MRGVNQFQNFLQSARTFIDDLMPEGASPTIRAIWIAFPITALLGLFPDAYVGLQVPLFRFLNSLSTGTLPLWKNVTELGNAYLLLCCFSWLILVNPRVWAALIASVPVGALISVLLKAFFAMPRPAAVLDPGTFNVAGDPITSFNSLPSGHTLTVFTLSSAFIFALILSDGFPKRQRWIWSIGLAACIVGLSRVFVGAHWPLDVIFGALLGVVAGGCGTILAFRYTSWWAWMEPPQNFYIHILILALLCAGMINSLPNLPLAWLVQHFAYVVMGLIAYQSRTVILSWLANWRSQGNSAPQDETLPPDLEKVRENLRKRIGKKD